MVIGAGGMSLAHAFAAPSGLVCGDLFVVARLLTEDLVIKIYMDGCIFGVS